MYCTMAHFSLGISANDLQVPGRHEEAILLLWGGLGEESGQEHAQVKVQRLRPSAVNKAVKNCHGMGAWRECYGREASMRIHGGDSGRDKKKKKWSMCQLEFSKCILERQSTVLFSGLSNKELHSRWNKHAALHFFVTMQKVHLQHSPIFDMIDLKKRMNPNQKMDQTFRASLSSMGWSSQLRMSVCWRRDVAERSVLSIKYRKSIFFFFFVFLFHVLKVEPGGNPSLSS